MLSDLRSAADCADLREPADASIPSWDSLTAAARAGGQELGRLDAWLEDVGAQVAGVGPGAALALAGPGGAMRRPYTPAPPADEAAAWGFAVADALLDGADAVVVDAGDAAAGVAALDARVGAIFAGLASTPAREATGNASVLVAAVSNPEPALGVTFLAPGANGGLGTAAGEIALIRSTTTHTAGLVSSLDLTRVLEAAVWAAPVGVADPWSWEPAGLDPVEAVGSLVDLDQHARARLVWGQFGWVLTVAVAALAVFGLATLLLLRSGYPRRKRREQAAESGAVPAESSLSPHARTARKDAGRAGAEPRSGRRPVGAAWRWVALAAGAFPAAGFAANAVPWWRTPMPPAVWLGVTALLAAVVGLAAWIGSGAGRRRRVGKSLFGSPVRDRGSTPGGVGPTAPGAPPPPGSQTGSKVSGGSALRGAALVGLASAAVMAADPFLGGLFTRDAPLGHPTLLGARFFGYANTSFAVLATGAMLTAAWAATGPWRRGRRLGAAAVVGGIGLMTVVLVGHPGLGADFGGAIAAAASFLLMAVMAADVKLGWRLAAGALATGAGAGAAVALADYARGPERWTHLGAFVDTALTGGIWEVLARKGAMWARLSVGPALAFAVAAAVLVWMARRGAFAAAKSKAWESMPLRRPLVAGLSAMLLLGSLVNDSGLVVAVAGLAVVGPLTLAALLRAAQP
jgi:hypothetical protein